MEIIKESNKNINMIVAALKKGAVLVLSTDTVYGLVCDARNEKALGKIFLIKKRPKSKPLLIFSNKIGDIKKIAYIDKQQEKILNKKWPGRVTVILELRDNDFSSLIKKNNTIGVRIPDYRFLNLILKKFGGPLAQTSANVSNNPATTEIENVINQFKKKKNQPDIIVDAGDLPKSEPSTIINIVNNNIKIIRK